MTTKGAELATLADYDRAGDRFNVLHPIVQVEAGAGSSPFLVESVSIVKLEAGENSPDTFNDYRFANARQGVFALSGLALTKIATAAGVKWIPDMCVVEARERRPDGHVYLRYRAAAAIRQPNGEWHIESASKEIDTADVADALRDRDMRARTSGRKEYSDAEIEDRVRQQVLQVREFILPLAETKAKNRVIRRLLSLQQTYTKQELAKPFVVPRLLYRPDATDPMQLEQIQIEGRRAAQELYGDRAPGVSSPPAQLDASSESSDAGGVDPAVESASPTNVQDEVADAALEPSADPKLTAGPHKDERLSEVVDTDPEYLLAVASGEITSTPKLQELAGEWLHFAGKAAS